MQQQPDKRDFLPLASAPKSERTSLGSAGPARTLRLIVCRESKGDKGVAGGLEDLYGGELLGFWVLWKCERHCNMWCSNKTFSRCAQLGNSYVGNGSTSITRGLA